MDNNLESKVIRNDLELLTEDYASRDFSVENTLLAYLNYSLELLFEKTYSHDHAMNFLSERVMDCMMKHQDEAKFH